MSFCLSPLMCVSVYVSVCLPLCLPACLSVCLSCLSVTIIKLTLCCFQRLSYLLREQKFLDALALALTFYTGTAKAVVGQTVQLGGDGKDCSFSNSTGLDGSREMQKAEVVHQVGKGRIVESAFVILALATKVTFFVKSFLRKCYFKGKITGKYGTVVCAAN